MNTSINTQSSVDGNNIYINIASNDNREDIIDNNNNNNNNNNNSNNNNNNNNIINNSININNDNNNNNDINNSNNNNNNNNNNDINNSSSNNNNNNNNNNNDIINNNNNNINNNNSNNNSNSNNRTSYGIRIYLLELLRTPPLLLVFLFVASLVTATILGIVLNRKQGICKPDLQLWLGITAIRSVVNFLLKVYLAAIEKGYITGNVITLIKINEMIEIFGMIWFSVGNLLVFNYTSCTTQYPIIVFTSFFYIAIIYSTLLIPILIRLSFLCWPNTRGSNNDFLDRGANRELPSSELNENDRVYWKTWLIQRGCFETTYKSMNTDRIGQDIKDYSTYDNCPVCLLDFNDIESESEGIINFPCTGQHYFHSDCLFQWLNTSRFRGENNITCPYCRQNPSV